MKFTKYIFYGGVTILLLIIILIIILLKINKENFIGTTDYIISITTIPSRIELTEPIIKSFLDQDIGPPKKIIINIPKKYNRFPNKIIKIPLFFKKYKEIYINNIDYDYGPGSKLLGLKDMNINPNTIILVTDDDNIKKKNWAKILTDNIKQNQKSISSIHHEKVYGGRGFGFYKKTIDIKDIIDIFFKVKDSCLLVDDDLFTNYCKYRNININHITGVYPLYAETNVFKDKLRDGKGDEDRNDMTKKCHDRFNELKYI